jgi:hypothetical protein
MARVKSKLVLWVVIAVVFVGLVILAAVFASSGGGGGGGGSGY